MCDPVIISNLYASVLHEDILKYHITNSDIRTGIQNMKEVYLPNPMSLTSDHLDVANYDDPAHRCAYLHKYAPFHTGMVAEMLSRAVLDNPKVFRDLLLSSGSLSICSLGGGPGSDVIGVMSVLNSSFGFFQVSATIVDCMPNWRQTFASLIQELRYGAYGTLGQCVTDQYFSWNYLGCNLLGTMSNDVNKAIARANLLTMIKFVSASACKDTPAMIKKIFRTMKPGALVLYIDNAGGGFHQLVRTEAQLCNLITVFGPLEHQHYTTNDYNIKRFGYTPCLETKVSVQIWRKSSGDSGVQQVSNRGQPKNNKNRSRSSTPGRGNTNRSRSSTPGTANVNANTWNNMIKNYQGVPAQNLDNRRTSTPDNKVNNKSFQTTRTQAIDNRHPSTAVSTANRNLQGVQSQNVSNRYSNFCAPVMQSTNVAQSRPRGRSPTRSVIQQPRNIHYARPNPGSGYRPAPSEDTAEEEAEQGCCCVIS